MSLNLDDKMELEEFLEQVSYALSLEFREKWRHRYSESFINIFQDMLIQSFNNQKRIKMSVMESQFCRKYGYDLSHVRDFFRAIDITLYYPIIYRDSSCSE
jgi:putative hemolysin